MCSGRAQGFRRGGKIAEAHARGMNDVTSLEFAGSGYSGVTNGNTADCVALLLDRRPSLAKNCASNPGPEDQVIVRGVDDGVDVHLGDVALLDQDAFG